MILENGIRNISYQPEIACYLKITEADTDLDKGCGNAQEAVQLEAEVWTGQERHIMKALANVLRGWDCCRPRTSAQCVPGHGWPHVAFYATDALAQSGQVKYICISK